MDNEFLKQVGRVTVTFSMIDFSMGLLIAGLMNVNVDIGQMVTTEQSFRQKISLLSSLGKYAKKVAGQQPELLAPIEKVIPSLVRSEERRNAVAHSLWATGIEEHAGKHVRIKITAKQAKGLHHVIEHFTSEQLKSIADEMEKVNEELTDMVSQIAEARARAAGAKPEK